jgi:ketosteroid isomerase-like protein
MRARLLAGMLGGLAITSCRSQASSRVEPVEVAQQIISLERSALDRWIHADPDGYLSLYASQATYFDPFRDKRVDGLDELRARVAPMRDIKLPFTEPRYEMIDPRVDVEGNTAVLTFNLVNYGKPSASAQETVLARWNATEVYRRMNGSWRIIHTHWSFTQSQPKPAAGQ